MEQQTLLTKKYIENIFEEVECGKGLERFLESTFPVDKEKLLRTNKVKHPDDLCDRMNPTTDGDFASAIALYEAYENLSPLQASDAQLWESLALTDLFPYMQQRWKLKEANDLKRSIINHFQVKSHGILRQGLSGLWWLVHLTIDEKRENRYELTEIVFKNYTLRYIRFGVGRVIQHKEAAIGILQFIKDHFGEITSLENVANGLTSYFNRLGAVKQLTFLDREFFYKEMENHIEEFKLSTTHYTKEETEELEEEKINRR